MIRDITIGQYYPAKSVVHKLDPRVKLFVTLLYIIALFIYKGIAGFALITLFLVASIRISKVPFKFIVKGLKAIVVLLIITSLFNLLLTPTGENANKKNLITGTRYLNVEGMLPYEEKTAEYIEKTGNHMLYRVTPIFEGNNLLASGVLMEGYSVEDQGKGISFCVYCYNVQPGVTIDYATGDSHISDKSDNSKKNNIKTYILNTNTKKFHKPTCKSVKQMSAKNKKQCKCTRDELIKKGYSPCKNCNP